MSVEIGQKAPLFTLPDQHGDSVSLSDYAGKKVALYFYPKDNTPGCTAQACNLRDNYNALNEHGITIIGVSFDDSGKHSSFREKYSLPFTLLADVEKAVAPLYGATKKFFFTLLPKRMTFLIDENGVVVDIIKKVKTDNHAQQIIDCFSKDAS